MALMLCLTLCGTMTFFGRPANESTVISFVKRSQTLEVPPRSTDRPWWLADAGGYHVKMVLTNVIAARPHDMRARSAVRCTATLARCLTPPRTCLSAGNEYRTDWVFGEIAI